MTAVVAADRLRTEQPRPAFAALLALDLRLIARGGILLVTVIAGLTAVVVLQYAVTFASPEEVRSLEVLVGNPAIRVLFGVPRALDQAGGFTVWRTGTFTAVAAAAWALATATRLTRGQEDTGRAWLTLVGPLRLRSALLAHLLVIAAVLVAFGLALGLAMVASGAGGSGAATYATGTALTGLLFAACRRRQRSAARRAAVGDGAGRGTADRWAARPDGGGRDRLAGVGVLADAVRAALPERSVRGRPVGTARGSGSGCRGGRRCGLDDGRSARPRIRRAQRSGKVDGRGFASCPTSGASLSAGRCRRSSAGRWRWPRTFC